MNLNPGNCTLRDNPAPLRISRLGFWQKEKLLFDELETPVRLAGGETQTISLTRARTHVPKFRGVLKRVEERRPFRNQAVYGGHNNFIIRATGKGEEKKNVGIQKVSGDRH